MIRVINYNLMKVFEKLLECNRIVFCAALIIIYLYIRWLQWEGRVEV